MISLRPMLGDSLTANRFLRQLLQMLHGRWTHIGDQCKLVVEAQQGLLRTTPHPLIMLDTQPYRAT